MKLHVGCGSVYLSGYVNIDGKVDYIAQNCPSSIVDSVETTFEKYYKYGFAKGPQITVADMEHDICQCPMPFKSNSIDEIVMEQVLEHFPSYDVGRVINEIYRILKVGGIFITSVPDLKETAKLLYEAKMESEEDWAIRLIHGTQKNNFSHHYCGYTERTIKTLLSNHGFGCFEDLPKINCYPVIRLKSYKEER
jgi:SAM-dependent methyltransferase